MTSHLCVLASSDILIQELGAVSALLSFLRTVVFQVLCVVIFPMFLGINGIWFSISVAEMLAVSVTVSFLIGMRKRYF